MLPREKFWNAQIHSRETLDQKILTKVWRLPFGNYVAVIHSHFSRVFWQILKECVAGKTSSCINKVTPYFTRVTVSWSDRCKVLLIIATAIIIKISDSLRDLKLRRGVSSLCSHWQFIHPAIILEQRSTPFVVLQMSTGTIRLYTFCFINRSDWVSWYVTSVNGRELYKMSR